MAARAGAAELVTSRALYDGMCSADPDFDEVLGNAEGAAAIVETNIRRMSRSGGSSRRAAVGRFVATHVARGGEGDDRILPVEAIVLPPERSVGTMAMGGVGVVIDRKQ
jgi:hypothetical protein